MVKCSSRRLDRTFSALADPTRRRILEHLSHGDLCVTDVARPYSMSLPAVSKHLRVLEKAGLVRRRRSGRVHSLRLEAKPMQQAQAWIEAYRKFWEESFDRLDEYLKRLQTQGNNEDTNNPSEEIAARSFIIVREFAARRELVGKAGTEPEQIRQWFGPEGIEQRASGHDPRPGGTFEQVAESLAK